MKKLPKDEIRANIKDIYGMRDEDVVLAEIVEEAVDCIRADLFLGDTLAITLIFAEQEVDEEKNGVWYLWKTRPGLLQDTIYIFVDGCSLSFLENRLDFRLVSLSFRC